MSESDDKPGVLTPRFCSEIQLFDLCDLESCRHKNGRYCADSELLLRFEKIAEDELRAPQRYISEDDEDEEGYVELDDETDEFEPDGFDAGENDGWEDDE